MNLHPRSPGFHNDIRRCPTRLWLHTFVARRWFASSQPNDGPQDRCPSRVRALIGRRMTKQARHAGTHAGCELPHASDDARLDLSSHWQAVRLSSGETDDRSRPIWAIRLPPQPNSGSRCRTREDCLRVVRRRPPTRRGRGLESPRPICRGGARTDDLSASILGESPPPPGSSELPSHARTELGRGDSARTACVLGGPRP